MTALPAARTVYSVAELTEILRALIEDSLPSLWVQGEISNFSRPASGHWYFTLKDARSGIRCAMFKSANYYVRPIPKDGDAVLVRARASVYPARGELQLIVEHLEPAGTGDLLRAFEVLKNKLAAEGLFDAEIKRPIPAVPHRIGLITSASGAAQHDVLTALSRRWPLAEVLFQPVPVQGAESVPAIVAALQTLPAHAPLDVILLVRGGGSIEDLWSFNDERVARAIRACAVPVVCGVGHETDTTIADYAADLRAATPTAAAELATPDAAAWRHSIDRFVAQLAQCHQRGLQRRREQLQEMARRLSLLHPERRLHDRAQRLDELALRLDYAVQRVHRSAGDRQRLLENRLRIGHPEPRLVQEQSSLDRLEQRLQMATRAQLQRLAIDVHRLQSLLNSFNPHGVLSRGYAVVRRRDGSVAMDAGNIEPGETLSIQLARGELTARRD